MLNSILDTRNTLFRRIFVESHNKDGQKDYENKIQMVESRANKETIPWCRENNTKVTWVDQWMVWLSIIPLDQVIVISCFILLENIAHNDNYVVPYGYLVS